MNERNVFISDFSQSDVDYNIESFWLTPNIA